MHKLEIIGVDISTDDCIPHVKVGDLGEVWGEFNARLLADAEEMFNLLKLFVAGKEIKNVNEVIDRIENSPALTSGGLTMAELKEALGL